MVTLQRGELQYGGDIGRFEVRIVRENFLLRRATRQQLNYVFYPCLPPMSSGSTVIRCTSFMTNS